MNLSVNLNVKQTIWAKAIFKISLFLGKNKILSADQVLGIVNCSLSRGAYKCKVDNGKWRKLKIDEIEL